MPRPDAAPRFATVAEAAARIGEFYPQSGYVFQDSAGAETRYDYPEVAKLTGERAGALLATGLKRGDRVGIVVVEPEDFVLTFLGALRAGIVPVPLYPPLSFGALDAYAERTARVLALSGAKVLVASSSLQNVLWGLVDQVDTLDRLVKVESLRDGTAPTTFPDVGPDDIAFLQYTSGSTSDPKGVIVSHGNLVANCDAIIRRGLEMDGSNVAVSWLPLYHDMGLIGFVIATLCHGLTSVFIPTMRFVRKPHVWFDAITKHKGNVTFAPNFAYALITRKAKPKHLESWDLSSMTAFGCGAEPIHPDVVRHFEETFAPCGLTPEAFLPAYGMAEFTLAISFKPIRDRWRSRVVDGPRFQADGLVADAEDADAAFEHVSCGPIFEGHEVAVFDESGKRLADGVEGELCLKGPSVTQGYWENPEATEAAYRDGWLHTGDLGYVLDGEIHVTGRLKDLIILNGRNLHPQSIEWRAAEVDGVRKGNVVAFSRPGAESEELVVVVETRETDAARRAAIVDGVKHVIRKEIGVPPADVVCLEPGSLPKTSSGKLQRRKTRQQYLSGALGAEGTRTLGSSGSTMTVAKHVARSVFARAKAAVRGAK